MLLSTRLRAAGLLLGGQLRQAYADSSALGFPFNNNGVGPDGPWNCLNVSTDAPAQYVDMFPSMIETSMLVNVTACQAQSARCPSQDLNLWAGSAASDLYLDRNSASWPPSEWEDMNGGYIAEAMDLAGSLRYISQRLTLTPTSGEASLDGLPIAVADNLTVNYPNGSFYTTAVGFYSLYAGQRHFSYSLPNGTQWHVDNQFWLGYNQSIYPSVSYGLHLGSTMHNVSGKFFLGGYDSSRCIDTPIAATDDDSFYLSDISLGVSTGSSAFLNHTDSASEITGLLQTNTSGSTLPLSTSPDPGLPYLYLPAATCDAIAAHLPVTYSADLNLYLWDTSSTAYSSIVSSPHYLALTFATSSANTTAAGTIALPLALLNLTLSTPLASAATPYFPCSAWDPTAPSSPDVILGRAFLQGAFLAQNWHTNTTWLAQAPGPGSADESVKTIGTGDGEQLATGGDGSAWNATWTSVLQALDGDVRTSPTVDTDGGDSGSGSGSGLSTGAKAGVGVGVAVGGVAVLAVVGWWVLRRRGGHAGKKQQRRREQAPLVSEVDGRERAAPQEVEGAERREIDGRGVVKPQEIDGRGVGTTPEKQSAPVELP